MMGERKESGDEDSIKVQPVATSLHFPAIYTSPAGLGDGRCENWAVCTLRKGGTATEDMSKRLYSSTYCSKEARISGSLYPDACGENLAESEYTQGDSCLGAKLRL